MLSALASQRATRVSRHAQCAPHLAARVPSRNLSGVCCPATLERMNGAFSKSAERYFESFVASDTRTALCDTFVKHARVQKGVDEILDVACGPGIPAVAMAKHHPRRIVGVDIAEGMIQLAKKHASENNVHSSLLEFQVCDAGHLPFENESFSLVTQRLGFHHFHDYERVFSEMVRVCRKGGRIVIMDTTIESDHGGQPSQAAVQLHTVIETLRDPTHHRNLLDGEVAEMARVHDLKGFTISEHELKVVNEGESWVGAMGQFDRQWATLQLMKSLCHCGVDTGMRLTFDDNSQRVFMTDHYRVWSAVKV